MRGSLNLRIPRVLVGATIALAVVWAIVALRLPQVVQAGGVVTTCDAAHLDAALVGGNTITFNCNNNYSPATIYFNSPRTINANTTIDGANGGNTISIVPSNDTRAFVVAQGFALTLKNLNISDGFDNGGGCIYTNGPLTLDNVKLQNCMAGTGTSGGALFVNSTGSATINNSQVLSNTAYTSGGGIYSAGSLTINGSYIAHNRLPDGEPYNPTGDGGGIWAIGNTTIDGTTVYSNTALNGYGGGIYNQGTLQVTNSTISSNLVEKGGGGIQTYLGTTTLQNVDVIDNTVTDYDSKYGGGGLMNSQGTLNLSNVTISGNGKLNNFAGGGIRNDGNATLSNVTVSNNHAEYGGGIRNTGNLAFTGGTVSGNTGYQTGGVYNMSHGSITLTNLVISDNQSQASGGGINNEGTATAILTKLTVTGNTAGTGGGIAGAITLVDSTVRGNTAYDGGGIWGGGYIYRSTVSGNTATNDGGGIQTGGTANIINSTISGNRAYGNGGGIQVYSGTTGLFNVTTTQNRANSDNKGSGYGGGVANTGGTFNFVNSIVANNYSLLTGPLPTLLLDDCYGTLNSQGYNIMYNTDNCTVTGSAPTLASPNLGPLQDNGGPTQTHALLDGSPAIDAGDQAGCKDNNGSTLTTDQRGYPRTANGRCDIGAYEFNSTPPTNTPTNTPTKTATRTATRTPTRTATATVTRTPTRTATRTTTRTATPTGTATRTTTRTITPTSSASRTPTLTPTAPTTSSTDVRIVKRVRVMDDGKHRYKLIVTNLGANAALGVKVTDKLPDSYQINRVKSASASCRKSARNVTCTSARLEPAAHLTIVILASPNGATGRNCATVTLTNLDSRTINNKACVKVP